MCKTLLFHQSYKLVDVNTLQYFEFVKNVGLHNVVCSLYHYKLCTLNIHIRQD